MADEGRLDRRIRGKVSSRPTETAIARLASRQQRLVTRSQLVEIGLNLDQIDRRIAALRLVIVHRGVYAVGPGPLTIEGRWLAATLFAGPDSLLSHFAAVGSWGLRPWHGGVVDVTAPRRIEAPRGLRAHRSAVPADECSRHNGIPLTRPGRTILDCAATCTRRDVERMLNEAHVLGLPIRPSLSILLDRYPRRRGAVVARAALASLDQGTTRTKSELEERFLAFLDRHGYPRPLFNHRIETPIGTLEVDCFWPARRLVIELDGFATHGQRRAFHLDHRRDRALRVVGYAPSRVTWDDLDYPEALAGEMDALLAA